jgi:septal ring factor EnvC (AmiA/AmiB activator)
MRVRSQLVGFLLATSAADAADHSLNPVRKVVNLLQGMQKKVTAEGEREKDLYEKFMCYCKTGGGDLSASISAAETKVPAVSSDIEESKQKLTQTKSDLKQAQDDRAAAKQAMAEATALRKKEAAAFAAEKAEYETNIAGVKKAVVALSNGMSGSFLQTQTAQALRVALSKQDMPDGDRQEVVAFLSGSQGHGYAPASGEITGILKAMGDSMSKHLSEITSDEESSIQTFDALIKAKTKEVGALTTSIEVKTKQIGDLGVHLVQLKEDLSDTAAALAQDKTFLADLQKSCSTKTADWEEISKTRADELVALADTIKILNDDDALELFKKTLPGSSASASFMEVSSADASARTVALRNKALNTLRRAHVTAPSHEKVGLDLIMLALMGKKSLAKGAFDKVISMIDKMVGVLKQEQTDDDNKKEYCALQLDQIDDKKKSVSQKIDDTENNIAAATETIATLKDEIKALESGIKALDKSVAEATEQRKAENAEFKELMASDSAAKDLLNLAKNRLNKFYNPKLYKPPAKEELSREDRIAQNFGGAVFVQISEHKQYASGAPPPPPETFDAYTKKTEENGGVVAMLNLLIKDLDKEMTEAETDEKDGQTDYETMMKESSTKRTSDSKALTGKTSTLADTEGELESLKEENKAAGSELMAVSKYMASLHAECDWLLQYHDVRKEARADEIESLKNAKAVLSGADYAMLEVKTRGGFLSN